jgi:hypothetical protein
MAEVISEVRHEVEVDTRIAEASRKMSVAQHLAFSAADSVLYALDHYRAGVLAVPRLLEEFEAKVAAGEVTHQYVINRVRGRVEEYNEAFRKYEDAIREYDTVSEEYGGWSRFFSVPGGHIHSSMNCSTCNRNGNDTVFAWLPKLSGLTEADAVADQGARLCTICFPSAPVEYTNMYDLERQAKMAKRCPGSGQYIPLEKDRSWARWGKCPVCDESVSRTSLGLARAHNKKG